VIVQRTEVGWSLHFLDEPDPDLRYHPERPVIAAHPAP
jgi:hypothetical protein